MLNTILRPNLHIKNKTEQRQVTLIAVLMLISIIANGFSILLFNLIDPASRYFGVRELTITGTAVLFLYVVGYLLSRTRHYNYSRYLFVYALFTGMFTTTLLLPEDAEALLNIMVLGIITAGIIFTYREMLVLGVFYVLAILSILLFVPSIQANAVVLPVILFLTATALIIFFKWHRDLLECEHNAELAAAHERALEASHLKSQFLATMSHEIRTPMNGIIGLSEIMADGLTDPELKELNGIVMQESQHLLCLVNKILDFSKIEAGKVILTERLLNPAEIVMNVTDSVRAMASEKDLKVIVEIDPTVNRAVIGDRARIHQVLMCLVDNAIKFTHEGQVMLYITKLDETATAIRLKFEVRDTGIGIAPEKMQHLFQPFTQADGSNKRKYGGVGLGLATCQRLVGLMGGEIGMESAENIGSVFWFDLTLSKSKTGIL